jgi:hypothetical protein
MANVGGGVRGLGDDGEFGGSGTIGDDGGLRRDWAGDDRGIVKPKFGFG